ncbi:MAG: type I glutamate--ammonia ligase [Nitrososphaerales archaeon]
MPYVRTAEGLSRKSLNVQDVMNKIQSEDIRFIDLQFTDVPGKLQHVTVPSHTIDADAWTNGIPKLDGSSIRGFTGISESDMLLKPDPNTFVVIPWSDPSKKYARVLCSINWGMGHPVHKGGPLAKDPRGIAQKAEEFLKESGYGYSIWGPELEFFVFDGVTWDVNTPAKGQSYSIRSKEAAWKPGGPATEQGCGKGGINVPIRHKEGYFPTTPQDTLMDFRNDATTILEDDFGIMVDAHHHEVATAGQCEINMMYDTLVNQADSAQSFKYVIKNVAHQKGMVATFMPKPLVGDNGSGMHCHQSIWKDGKNIFYDETDEHSELSQTARYYIGGIMAHTRALACIVAPTTNSYKRLVPGFEAPIYIAWSRSNRSANVRVPINIKGNPKAKRIEFRCPDTTANPYLAFPAMLCAGLDGIKNKIDCGNPVDENIYTLSEDRKRELNIKSLPRDLAEAADALESDHDFLKPVFDGDLLETILEFARDAHFDVASRTHPYEFQLYFDA